MSNSPTLVSKHLLFVAVFGEPLFFGRCILLVAYLFTCCTKCNQEAVSMSFFKVCWPYILQHRFHHITACAWNSTNRFMNNFIRNYYFLNNEFEHYITAILQPDGYMAIVTCNMWLWKPHNCVLLNTCLEIVNAYYGYGVSKVSQILWSILCYMKGIWQQELLTMYSKQSHMSFPS